MNKGISVQTSADFSAMSTAKEKRPYRKSRQEQLAELRKTHVVKFSFTGKNRHERRKKDALDRMAARKPVPASVAQKSGSVYETAVSAEEAASMSPEEMAFHQVRVSEVQNSDHSKAEK